MKIPKYISHPFLLLLTGGILLYVFWLKTPSASDIQEAAQQPKTEKHLFQIVDFYNDGNVVLNDKEGKWLIKDERFHSLTDEKTEELKGFFVGKFVNIPKNSVESEIELPMELYDPRCFGEVKDKSIAGMCPLYIKK